MCFYTASHADIHSTHTVYAPYKLIEHFRCVTVVCIYNIQEMNEVHFYFNVLPLLIYHLHTCTPTHIHTGHLRTYALMYIYTGHLHYVHISWPCQGFCSYILYIWAFQGVCPYIQHLNLRHLTSSYMNWRVRADLPTPPLPTIMTLCRARELWFLLLLAAILRLLRSPSASGKKTPTKLLL